MPSNPEKKQCNVPTDDGPEQLDFSIATQGLSEKESGPTAPPPPAYSEITNEDAASTPTAAGKPEAPAAIDLTAAFSKLSLSNDASDPDIDRCLCHLKLLHAFHNLKEEIGYTDGLWDLWDDRADECVIRVHDGMATEIPIGDLNQAEDGERRKDFLAKLREKRWALFVARAVDRYEAWWNSMFVLELDLDVMVLPASPRYESFPTGPMPAPWQAWMLPPLDVLMVWHAHMLNPRSYLEDCMRYRASSFWKPGMPWELVNAAIDSNFNYNAGAQAESEWTKRVHRQWDNIKDPLEKRMGCPSCSKDVDIPWTTCGRKPGEKTRPGLSGRGYGDNYFRIKCTECNSTISNKFLSLARFCNDSYLLGRKKTPMPGTILDPKLGMPRVLALDAATRMKDSRNFPNRLLRHSSLSYELSTMMSDWVQWDMDRVRVLIERTLEDHEAMWQLTGGDPAVKHRKYKLEPTAKICVRKMMAAYWDNHSIFSLDLGGAVMRQSVFVGKMVNIDWLHSPNARDTMARLLRKYQRFFSIMAHKQDQIAVPTLDVDLAWHTHQLSPSAYYQYSVRATGKFVDHNDKIDETKLSKAFEWTSKVYQQRYGEVYSECTCWYCETIRVSHISSVGKFLGASQQEKLAENFHTSGAASFCPPDRSAHISAHNAVRTTLKTTNDVRQRVFNQMRARHQRKLDENYAKACRRAEKKGRKLPPKDEYYDHWGYAYLMYAPYYYPIYFTPGIYPGADPCQVTSGEGAWADCCQGACGQNSIAAGGCGGPGGCGGQGSCGGAVTSTTQGGGGACNNADGGDGGGGCGGDGGGCGGCGG